MWLVETAIPDVMNLLEVVSAAVAFALLNGVNRP